MLFKVVVFLLLLFCCCCFFSVFFSSVFSSGGHFVQPSGTILAILVKGHKRNISVKLF